MGGGRKASSEGLARIGSHESTTGAIAGLLAGTQINVLSCRPVDAVGVYTYIHIHTYAVTAEGKGAE